MQYWQANSLDQWLLELSFREDLGNPRHDVTVESLVDIDKTGDAQSHIISKHATPITVAGIAVLRYCINRFHFPCRLNTRLRDGQVLYPGQCLMTLYGPINILLILERIFLNFLCHLSAIATLTTQFVEQVQGTHCQILDTRKTTPGLRHLEKYAVQCGGGVNHRMGLYDAIMIKDTHIDLIGGLQKLLNSLPKVCNYPVIIEIRNLDELDMALFYAEKIDRVLFDNMDLTTLKRAVDLCRGKTNTEASGNINLKKIKAIAQTGVQYASVGLLTHSAGQVDLSMKI